MTSADYYGGIEGGATHSKCIVCAADGRVVATITGPDTNHWNVGIAECAKRIAAMVAEAKSVASVAADQPLRSLCLSLSGCEQAATNRQLEEQIRAAYPHVAEHYVVCSDTLGGVATVSAAGGLVLIAGTGSNALLANPDGRQYTCGGWGHMLGDEGGGMWIAHRAVKTCIDHLDGLESSEYDVQPVWQLIRAHFGVEGTADLLSHYYENFNKSRIAKLSERLAQAANEGDALSAHIFRQAGEYLGKSTVALLPRVSAELVAAGSGALNVVCVGSVWHSWPLLRPGFVAKVAEALKQRADSGALAFDLRMVRLVGHMAMGAVYMGVDAIGAQVPRRYEDNYEVFHVIAAGGRLAEKVALANGNGVAAAAVQTNGKH